MPKDLSYASVDPITAAEVAAGKQDTLVSGTNIKTINSNSVLGAGDLVIDSGSFSGDMDDIPDGSTYVKTENNYTDTEKSKLSGIAAGAEVNVNADWNSGSGDSQILNKPSIPVVSDTAYGASWDGNTDAPSKNAVYDKIETLGGGITLLDVYPVGSIYISISSTNPASLFGGTWSAFGAGKVLVGLDSGDADFDTAEETGGAKTVQSSAQTFAGNALANHNHGVSGITVGNESSHTHGVTSNVTVGDHSNHTMSGSTGQASAGSTQRGSTTSTLTLATHTHTVGTLAVNAHSAHSVTNNAVTSGAGSSHNHSLSGNDDNASAGTPSGTNTAGAATSVVQPYIVVYMWKRTA